MTGPDALRRVAAAAGRVLQVDRVAHHLSRLEHRAVAAPGTVEPAAGAARREVTNLCLHVAGAGLAAAGAITGTARLPAGVPTFVGAVVNLPQLRDALRAAIGPERAERLLVASDSAMAVLSGQPIGELVNAVHGVQRLAEARARQRVWQRRAGTLIADGHPEPADPAGLDADAARPVPLPPGPVERYAAQAASAGMAGLLGGLLSARPQLRVAALAGASAKAARLTKESWASRVGRAMADHDVVVVDSRVFRRLDRVDTVVVEAELLTTGRWGIDELVPTRPDLDPGELFGPALRLLETGGAPADGRTREPVGDGWSLRPAGPYRPSAYRELARRLTPGGRLLVLRRYGEPVALVAAAPELDPYAEAVIAAARRVGGVYVAGIGSHLGERLPVDGVVPGGNRLAGQVRRLQRDGHGVLLLARHGRRVLAVADCAVAVADTEGRRPVHSHLICGRADLVTLVAAVPAARRAARGGVLTAGYGAAAGAVVGLTGEGARRAGRDAGLATNLAALAGIAVGAWHADPVVRRRPPTPVDRSPWHAVPVPEVLRRLGSSLRGLTGQEASRRPHDARPEEPPEGVGRHTLHELENPLTPALTAGAGLAAASGSTLDSALIGLVLAVNAVVGGLQRWGATRALGNLARRTAVPLRLRRDDHTVTAAAEDLVRGDIVELRAGDAVPADCRVVQAEGLELDEASLTGESLPVPKTAAPTVARQPLDRTSMVYEGTAVAAGRALAAVVAAGGTTQVHRMRTQLPPPSAGGVQQRLQRLTSATLPLSLWGGAALLTTSLLRGRSLRESVAPAVSLAVAAVPEGLPSVATVAQLAAANRLSRRGVLVRNPAALESLGRLRTLCFDKTGTLTEGRLRLRSVCDGEESARADELPDRLRAVLAAALRASPRPVDGRLAHPTDQAVVNGGRDAGVADTDGCPDWTRLEELPFEPARGFHAVLGRDGDRHLLSVKGAPEVVLARCATRLLDGGTTPLSAEQRARLTRRATALARSGHRVLAVAEGPATADALDSEADLGGLRFVGFLALADRARPAAARAVHTLRRAGVRVVMVTGDHPSTAEAVASELDLIDGGQVMTGAEIDECGDDELRARLPEVAVFARVDPSHKVRVVRLLREAGEVVAVTGDGANDAPAIRSADVGLALGSRATAAARQAADVVVTDNRIETVVDAVVEGRVLWASVREAVAVLLGGNVGEVAVTVGSGLLGARTFSPRQLLLVNLLTDVVPAMALAARPPRGVSGEDLLAEGPGASLGRALDRDLRTRAAVTAAAAAAAWLAARFTGSSARATTVALVALVAAQLGQTMRAGRGDPVILAACLASLGVLLAAVQVPGVSHLLGCRPVGPLGWGIALAAAGGGTLAASAFARCGDG